jgi:beta-mannosidase
VDFGQVDADLSDNALVLLPGERTSLRIASGAKLDTLRSALRIRSLADALPSDSPLPRSLPTP